MSDNQNIPAGNRNQQEEESIDIRMILESVWGLRYWIILSLIVCMGLVYAYTWYSTPVYETSGSIMLMNDDGRGNASSSEIALMSELSGVSVRQKMSNELYILKTTTLMQRVVEELGLHIQYFEEDRIKTTEFYKNNPLVFKWENPVPIASGDIKPMSIHLTLKPAQDGYVITEFSVANKEIFLADTLYKFGNVVTTSAGLFSIQKNPTVNTAHTKHVIRISNPRSKAKAYATELTTNTVSEGPRTLGGTSDIILLSILDEKPQRSVEMLHSLIRNYIEDNRMYKAASIEKSIVFINSRLNDIERELGLIESEYRSFRVTQGLVEETSQSQLALTTDARYRQEMTDLEVQVSLLNMVKEYMEAQGSEHDMIPANLGLKDVGLIGGIEQYNELVVERNRLLAGSSLNNPRVVTANLQLENMRNGIEVSIENVSKTYDLRIKSLREQISAGKREISSIPGQQLELARLTRQQEIIEPLYRLLQQKKEEAMISLYGLPDNARIMEEPNTAVKPAKPNKRNIYLLGILAGLLIPPGVFFTKQTLRRKVDGKRDLEKKLTIPVFATIPKAKNYSGHIDIKSKDSLTEGFRMLRSNLQYIEGKVIHITSSIPGEGKTFVATNLAIALAATGKKVILVGADLRQPKIHETFGISNRIGLVSYLIGKVPDIRDLIVSSGIDENLELLPAGPIPPNPSELLST
ncbi:MAG: GNVR domain-containing protein, partial [Petrimonas sp.]|nr:GNVR domain-containing protein [Petrimonas sp.]